MNSMSPLNNLPKRSVFKRHRQIESLEHLLMYHDREGDVLPGASMMETEENNGDGWQFGASGQFIRDPEEGTVTLLLKGVDPEDNTPVIQSREINDHTIQRFGAWVYSRTVINPQS